jgi:hypothetical protein
MAEDWIEKWNRKTADLPTDELSERLKALRDFVTDQKQRILGKVRGRERLYGGLMAAERLQGVKAPPCCRRRIPTSGVSNGRTTETPSDTGRAYGSSIATIRNKCGYEHWYNDGYNDEREGRPGERRGGVGDGDDGKTAGKVDVVAGEVEKEIDSESVIPAGEGKV